MMDDGRLSWAFWPETYTRTESGGIKITRFGYWTAFFVAWMVWMWVYE